MKILDFLKRHKQFTVFLFLAIVVICVAIFAPIIAPMDPYEAVMSDSLKAPGSDYICGADKLGRDVLSRVIYGTRTSLTMTLSLVSIILVIGNRRVPHPATGIIAFVIIMPSL